MAANNYKFTAMNTLKGQRIRAASSAGNTVGLENWFNIDKIHKIYEQSPVPKRLLKLEEVYLLEAPAGEPIRLVRLDDITEGGRADLFDVTRQETLTVDLGDEYQLHKYYPDAVIPSVTADLNITSGPTRASNFNTNTTASYRFFSNRGSDTNLSNFHSFGGVRRENNSSINIMKRRATKKNRQRGGMKQNPFAKTRPVSPPNIYAQTNAGLKPSNYMENQAQKKKSPFTKKNRTINASQNALTLLSNAELNAKFNTALKAMTANVMSVQKQREFNKYLREKERRSGADLARAEENMGAAVRQANENNAAITAAMARLGLNGAGSAAWKPQEGLAAGEGNNTAIAAEMARLGISGSAGTGLAPQDLNVNNIIERYGGNEGRRNNAAANAEIATLLGAELAQRTATPKRRNTTNNNALLAELMANAELRGNL